MPFHPANLVQGYYKMRAKKLLKSSKEQKIKK